MTLAAARPRLHLPQGDRLLLHSCCAPCSGELMEACLASGIGYTIFSATRHPSAEGIRTAQAGEHPFCRETWRARRRCRLRHRQRVRPCQGHGERARTRHPLHGVLRHALRTHRAACARTRLTDDDPLAGHLALEEHGADQRLRTSRRRALREAGVLGTTGARAAAASAWSKSPSASISTSRNIAGCMYSLRDSNRHRLAQRRGKIRFGVLYYGNPPAPAITRDD